MLMLGHVALNLALFQINRHVVLLLNRSKMRLDDSYSDTNAGSNLTTLESPKQNDDPRDSFSRSEYHTLFG